MTKRNYLYLDEIKPSLQYGGPIIASTILNTIKKYKGNGNKLYHRNVYNLVDPTAAIPKTVFDLYNYKLIADEALKPKGYIKKYREKNEPLAEAAWAKRLGLPYDTSILISNDDGTVRLNDKYEQELPIDTNFYKTRIANNKALLQKYSKGGGTERNKVLKMAIGEDEAALNALRKTYKTGKWVSFNEQAHKSRQWINNGDVKLDISPLSALQNFSGRYNANDNTFEYFDIYDFNNLEPVVPGKPFTIKGKINLNKKYGGLVTTRPSLKTGGKINKKLTDAEYVSKLEEVAKNNYEKWGFNNEDEALIHVLNDHTYDYRGYYDKYPNSKANAETHWPDEFKTYLHPTFSNESKYSGKKSKFNPNGLKGGIWIGDVFLPQAWQLFRPSLKTGGSIYIKPSHRGRLTELKARTGKSESELYNDGNPAHKKMVVFARNARKWHH